MNNALEIKNTFYHLSRISEADIASRLEGTDESIEEALNTLTTFFGKELKNVKDNDFESSLIKIHDRKY